MKKKLKRKSNGQFAPGPLMHDGWSYHISTKGYPRFSGGPHRNKYVHQVEAEKMLGRPLRKDEEVHHGRGGKECFEHWNLSIMGTRQHGWVSAKQAFWMRVLDIREEKHFYEVIEQLESEGVRTLSTHA